MHYNQARKRWTEIMRERLRAKERERERERERRGGVRQTNSQKAD